MHAIECAPTETPSNVFYVRTDIDGKQKDLRLTDLGFTQISTEGMQSASEVGGLWISYDITLLKPILNPQNAISDGCDQFIMLAPEDDMYSSSVGVRNNTLGGQITQVTSTALQYTWNPTISSGYYLSIIEFCPPADAKVAYINQPNWLHSYNHCTLVVDKDKNGPFNGAYLGVSSGILSEMVSPPYAAYSGVQNPIVEMFVVTGPNPYVTLTNLEFYGPSMYWRWSIFPISYNTVPEAEDPALTSVSSFFSFMTESKSS
jgi:hypothetical protein